MDLTNKLLIQRSISYPTIAGCGQLFVMLNTEESLILAVTFMKTTICIFGSEKQRKDIQIFRSETSATTGNHFLQY